MMLQNYIIHTLIYARGYNIPSEHKLSQIESVSGLYYLAQILLVVIFVGSKI
jgi:hypothetical protein